MPRLTDEQVAEHLTGIGASTMASIAGVDDYRTALETYLILVGDLDPNASIDEASRDRMERGHRLEDVALEWDRDITGEGFERVRKTVRHPRLPFLFCHPDARRTPWRKTRRLIEVKTTNRKWHDVPRGTEVQVQTQMACTGATSCDVLVLGFDGPPKRWLVERDDELIAALESLAASFWDRVQRRDPPPMDGSDGASRWLDRTRWRDEPEAIASNYQRDLVAQLVKVRAGIAELTTEDARLVNVIKDTMAGGARLNAPGVGRVNWTAPTTIHTTAWKEVAGVYRRTLDDMLVRNTLVDPLTVLTEGFGTTNLDDIEALYTTEREQRTFRLIADEREETK